MLRRPATGRDRCRLRKVPDEAIVKRCQSGTREGIKARAGAQHAAGCHVESGVAGAFEDEAARDTPPPVDEQPDRRGAGHVPTYGRGRIVFRGIDPPLLADRPGGFTGEGQGPAAVLALRPNQCRNGEEERADHD